MDYFFPQKIMLSHLKNIFSSSILINHALFTCSSVSFSVCSGIPTATTLLLAPVIKQFDCGMCRAGNVFGFLLVIEVWFCLWQCPLTVATWHLVMKMAQSWCGTSLVAVVSHLLSVTLHVSGHSLSGDPHSTFQLDHRKEINRYFRLLSKS